MSRPDDEEPAAKVTAHGEWATSRAQPRVLPPIEELPTNEARARTLRKARVRRWYLMQLPYFVVMGVVALAVVLVLVDRWRRGAFVFGGALSLGAVLRAVLPTSRAGLLQVRSRVFDVSALTALATVVLWMAFTIDPLGTR